MTGPPTHPYQLYQAVRASPEGPGDGRPTAVQVIEDLKLVGKLAGKTVLITGASSEIGIATAKALHLTGATLLLTAREVSKMDKIIEEMVSRNANMPTPEAIELRLDSLDDVRRASKTIESKTKALDVLICNAGIMAVRYSLTEDGLESHMGVNHFGHLLFQLLRPLICNATATSHSISRVVSVSSSGHWFSGIRFEAMHFKRQPVTYNKWKAYGQSKTANIYMYNALTRRYASEGIVGLSLSPGVVATNLIRHLIQSDQDGVEATPELMKAYKSPEQGAATTVWAALSPHFANVCNAGRYLADCGESGPTKPSAHAADTGYDPHACDEEKEERLWKLSLETVGV